MPFGSKIDYWPIYKWAKDQEEPFTAYGIEKALGLPTNSAVRWLRTPAFEHKRIGGKNYYTVHANDYDEFQSLLKGGTSLKNKVYRTYPTVAGNIELRRAELPEDLKEAYKKIVDDKSTTYENFHAMLGNYLSSPKDPIIQEMLIQYMGVSYNFFQFLADLCVDIISDPRIQDPATAEFAIGRRKDK